MVISVGEAYRNLAAAIVNRACYDYKAVLSMGKGEKYTYYNRLKNLRKDDISAFFRSEWCDTLVSHLNLTGRQIEEKLEELYGHGR